MSDYIKREDCIKRDEDYIKRKDVKRKAYDLDNNFVIDLCDVNLIPSADVAPVRHGEWKFDNETVSFFCSECNAEALLKYVVYRGCIQELSEYCPNCGARMDGENDEID